MYVVDYSKDDQVLSFSTKKEAEKQRGLCIVEISCTMKVLQL